MKKITHLLLAFCLLNVTAIMAQTKQLKPMMAEESFAQFTKEPRQGAAAYKHWLFQFHNANPLIEIYNLKTQKREATILLPPEPVVHCNNAAFSNQKYDRHDPFPLLYISSERDQRVLVYRIIRDGSGAFGLDKVQTIFLPDKHEAHYYFTNLILDVKGQSLWITGYTQNAWNKPDGGNQVRYVELPLPDWKSGDIHLTYEQRKSEFYTPYHIATQGAVFHKGKIYHTYGYNAENNRLRIINPKTGQIEQNIRLGEWGVTEEPEGAFVYKGKVMFVTCAHGYVYDASPLY